MDTIAFYSPFNETHDYGKYTEYASAEFIKLICLYVLVLLTVVRLLVVQTKSSLQCLIWLKMKILWFVWLNNEIKMHSTETVLVIHHKQNNIRRWAKTIE